MLALLCNIKISLMLIHQAKYPVLSILNDFGSIESVFSISQKLNKLIYMIAKLMISVWDVSVSDNSNLNNQTRLPLAKTKYYVNDQNDKQCIRNVCNIILVRPTWHTFDWIELQLI